MCYLVREQQAAAAGEGPGAPVPPSTGPLRPRWVGAAGAVLIGGFAFAALMAPTPTARLAEVKASGAAAPVMARVDTTPVAAGGNQTVLPMDDGVPTAAGETPKAAFGNCHHGM